jgi:hypothetical protein
MSKNLKVNGDVMKTGIQLIAEERNEQINKHGYNERRDDKYNHFELAAVSVAIINQSIFYYPNNWDEAYFEKIMAKPRTEQLTIAGALISAEIDRIQRIEVISE